jgi:hypothetical protein
MYFPRGFFSMFRTGSFTVFPKCDHSVTDAPITVPGLRTPRCHSKCTGRINPQCAEAAHQGFFQDVPCCEPNECSASVSLRIIPSVPSWLTSRYTAQVHPGCSEGFPTRYTLGTSRHEDDVERRARVGVGSSRDVSVGVEVAIVLTVCV